MSETKFNSNIRAEKPVTTEGMLPKEHASEGKRGAEKHKIQADGATFIR